MAARQKRRQKQQENETKIISPRIITKKDSITSIGNVFIMLDKNIVSNVLSIV